MDHPLTLTVAARSLYDWLLGVCPKVLDEQRHLDKGSAERERWHQGYASGLHCVATMLADESGQCPSLNRAMERIREREAALQATFSEPISVPRNPTRTQKNAYWWYGFGVALSDAQHLLDHVVDI